MDRWTNKVAVVTGASAGIGAQIAVDLAAAGMQVIGLARRVDRVELLRERLPPNRRDALHARRCDVSRPADVRETFAWIAENFGGCVHVLVNNAGCCRYGSLLATAGANNDDDDDNFQAVLATNLLGTVHCMREAVRLLDAQQPAQCGHVVNINSVSGHQISRNDAYVATMNVYPASKHGVTAATECVRRELNLRGNRNVRITSISPGLVDSEIYDAAGYPGAANMFTDAPHLKAADISAAVFYVLSAPQHVNVNEIMLRATGAP